MEGVNEALEIVGIVFLVILAFMIWAECKDKDK